MKTSCIPFPRKRLWHSTQISTCALVASARQVLAEGHVTPFSTSKITAGRCLGIQLPIACPRGIRHALLPAASNLGLFSVNVSCHLAPILKLELRWAASDCICEELLSSLAYAHPEVTVVQLACAVQTVPELCCWRRFSWRQATMARSQCAYGCSSRNSRQATSHSTSLLPVTSVSRPCCVGALAGVLSCGSGLGLQPRFRESGVCGLRSAHCSCCSDRNLQPEEYTSRHVVLPPLSSVIPVPPATQCRLFSVEVLFMSPDPCIFLHHSDRL